MTLRVYAHAVEAADQESAGAVNRG
jgi:hypothetical protein